VLQTGESDFRSAQAAFSQSQARASVLPFLDDMPSRLEASDLVICRSGAGTVFELAAAGRASVLVPYPHAAGGHQARNAEWMSKAGASLVVTDAEFTGARLSSILREAMSSPRALEARAAAARALARPNAAADIASMAEGLMAGPGR
jgi:UDP-N-acetylglucosamine--N-acetylmuramyl-(pentapeptide) pyrophosphoryl-undecaprenol N-acetylglucosamine transferase